MPILTKSRADTITPGSKRMAHGAVAGLFLVPSTKKGRGSWLLRFVSPVSGKRRDMGLGTYPEVSIADVRQLAISKRELLSKKIDPIDHALNDKSNATPHIVTFENAARAVYGEKLGRWRIGGKHIDQWINTMETYVFPIIGKRDVATLKPSDFALVLSPIWNSKTETAIRVKQRCHSTMKWCWAHQHVDSNPVGLVDQLVDAIRKKVNHFPAMTWQFIPDFWQNVLLPSNSISAIVLQFVILTAARSGEARGAMWDEIDFIKKVWSIPSSRMKKGQAHNVPLSPAALNVLTHQREIARHSTLVFPSPRGLILSDASLGKFLRDHKVPSSDPDKYATPHGFRSSFRDWASQNCFSSDLAEKALSHVVRDKTVAAYFRTDLLEQRRPMMEQWGTYVSERAAFSISDK